MRKPLILLFASLLLVGCYAEPIREETRPNHLYTEYYDYQADEAFDEWQTEKRAENKEDRAQDYERIAATEVKLESWQMILDVSLILVR